jgi:hypothetical protein
MAQHSSPLSVRAERFRSLIGPAAIGADISIYVTGM